MKKRGIIKNNFKYFLYFILLTATIVLLYGCPPSDDYDYGCSDISPWDIAIDTINGKIYWTDQWADKIQRANLDGTNFEDLVKTGISSPTDIALDVSGGKMYWTDKAIDKILRANVDVTGIEDIKLD